MGLIHPKCNASTSIADFLTFGSGELDSNGFWEKPCYECARVHEEKFPGDYPCWPFSKEYLKKYMLTKEEKKEENNGL